MYNEFEQRAREVQMGDNRDRILPLSPQTQPMDRHPAAKPVRQQGDRLNTRQHGGRRDAGPAQQMG